MMNISKKELSHILEEHKKWLYNAGDGACANLSGTDLRGANLNGVDLRGADLSSSVLCGTGLRGADLRRANLHYTDLRGADLYSADLSGADLSLANFRGADLCFANFSCASFCGANLNGAIFTGADLSYANFSGTDLSNTNFRYANINGVNIPSETFNKYFPTMCPESGEFIGWKKARSARAKDLIIKLKITENAKRSSAFGRKCRCSEAIVLAIENEDGTPSGRTEAVSSYDRRFIYRVGEKVSVANFDDDRWNECAPGIHFFITRQEAVDYK